MADIFLSYAEEDRETAQKIGALLESMGWSVWWDRKIPAGKDWRTVLEEALTHMRCMVVLWSKNSIKSDWVKEEAEEGRTEGKLVPILIDSVKPPVGFRAIQAADLIDWNGSTDFPGFIQLTAALQSILDNPENATSTNAMAISQELEHQKQNGKGRSQPRAILHWAKGLPWWSYAAATVLVTFVVATYVRRHEVVPGTPPSATLPVKALDASELETAPPPGPPTNAKTVNEPAPASPSPPHAPSPAKKTTQSVASGLRPRRPVLAQNQAVSARCTEILTRAQLGEPVPDADREFLGKECQR